MASFACVALLCLQSYSCVRSVNCPERSVKQCRRCVPQARGGRRKCSCIAQEVSVASVRPHTSIRSSPVRRPSPMMPTMTTSTHLSKYASCAVASSAISKHSRTAVSSRGKTSSSTIELPSVQIMHRTRCLAAVSCVGLHVMTTDRGVDACTVECSSSFVENVLTTVQRTVSASCANCVSCMAVEDRVLRKLIALCSAYA